MTLSAQASRWDVSPTISSPSPLPVRYVRVPRKLLAMYAYNPLVVGIYSLIARLYLVAQAPLPLSATDLTRYDPTLSRGAILPALTRLVRDGWLVADERIGHKTRYTPCWGCINGCPHAWQIGAPHLGRPRHIHVLALDLRLLDTYIGKLTPHAVRPAIVERYVTEPLLGLRDVGCYALALAGYAVSSPALTDWGLVRAGQPQLVPSDEMVLAHASQQAMSRSAFQLTHKGMRRLGLQIVASDPPAPHQGQPLVFVPRELIAPMIGQGISKVIDSNESNETESSASQQGETHKQQSTDHIPWESRGRKRNNKTPPPFPPTLAGGGSTPVEETRTEEHPPLPDTESAHLLHSLSVCPRVIMELAEQPAEVVRAAIADGQSRPHVRDLAGWVVCLVRDARDRGWQAPRPSSGEPDADFRASFARLGIDALATDTAAGAQCSEPASCVEREGYAASAEQGVAQSSADVVDLTTQIRQALQQRVERRWWPFIAGLTVCLDDDTLLLSCAGRADLSAVQTGLLPCMPAVLRDLGWTYMPRVVSAACPAVSAT